MFSEIFATFFGIKSLNNLLFDKFKCKMARALSYRRRERERDTAAAIIANLTSGTEDGVGVQKGDENRAFIIQ